MKAATRCGVAWSPSGGSVAWTYLSEFAHLFSCVVNGFLALPCVQCGQVP